MKTALNSPSYNTPPYLPAGARFPVYAGTHFASPYTPGRSKDTHGTQGSASSGDGPCRARARIPSSGSARVTDHKKRRFHGNRTIAQFSVSLFCWGTGWEKNVIKSPNSDQYFSLL